jgi:hypothetical protein
MTEKELATELQRNPFVPFRLHMVSGKTIDVLAPHAAWTLSHSLLVFRNPSINSSHAEGYDVLGYDNIERIELLSLGKRESKRKPA